MTKKKCKKMHFGGYFLQNPCIFEKKNSTELSLFARLYIKTSEGDCLIMI